MSHKIGLKLWSTNIDYYLNEAKRLYEQKVFDYIELYVVPDTTVHVQKWKSLKDDFGIEFAVHAPHFVSGLNFSMSENREKNISLITQTKEYMRALNPSYVVFHPGILGDVDESIRQMREIVDFEFVVENKPHIVPLGEGKTGTCIGSTPEQIEKIMSEVGCGFCLDVGHAICSANFHKEEIYAYLQKFNAFEPSVYHISGIESNRVYDQHLHLDEGGVDFAKLPKFVKGVHVAVEAQKDSLYDLNDFAKDSAVLKELLSKMESK